MRKARQTFDDELKRLETERAIIMERMNKIATDEGFIIAVDSLVHNALDLAIGATKVDENNLLRKIRNDYKEEAMRQSSLPTGRGLLMAINTRINAHRDVLREAERMSRPEHAWGDVWQNPGIRLLLAKGYQNDVAYAPFLQQYLEDPSKTLEELARQIKAKCDEIPYMFDKVVPGQVAAIFAATTEAANKPGRRRPWRSWGSLRSRKWREKYRSW
ncbi:unnamed protein product [Bathycoccus prasinos]